jgi:class 3 adenylate cyclase
VLILSGEEHCSPRNETAYSGAFRSPIPVEGDRRFPGILITVRAGLDMLEAVKTLRPYLEETYTKSFRIGIHFGEVVVGTIGHERMKRTTAIGDSVNFASRIESANKHAGTELLISTATYSAVREHVRVGKDIRVTLPRQKRRIRAL